MKKRFAAAMLSACLALGPCAGYYVPAYGAQQNAVLTDMKQSTLEVEVASTQWFPYEGNVIVKISDGSGRNDQKELTIAKDASAEAIFQVPQGDYTVSVQAEKFASYTQQIHTEAGWIHKIKVCSSKIQNGSSAAPGWLRSGDVDGDGDIDEDDSNALQAAIRAGKDEKVYDLNYDGKVDLADLNLLVQSKDEKQESAVEKLWAVNPSAVIAESGTKLIDGAGFEAMFQEEGSVKLQNESGSVISQEHPVEFAMDLTNGNETQAPKLEGMTIKAPQQTDGSSTVSQIADGTVTIVYLDADGTEKTRQISFSEKQENASLAAFSFRENKEKISTEADGSLVLDFGGQIAVKRVSVRITGTTKKEQNLVEIAKVTFINHMEDHIPAPQLDIPDILSVTPGSKKLTVVWSAQKNITGYELYVSGPVKNQSGAESQVIAVSDVSYEVSSINQKNLVNYKDYTLKVRSVNGDWRSPWSEVKTAKPLPQAKPAAPDNVKAAGGYRSITVSWKDMDDSDGYMVYYKEKDAAEYEPAVKDFVQTKEGTGRLRGTSYTINGLKEHAAYLVYVISWNEFGWSGKSLVSEAVTRSEAAPVLPSYRLLNTPNGVGQVTAHIVDAVIGGSGADMVNSPLDTKKNSGLGLVDNDYASYWSKVDWEDGVQYPAATKGMTITLDQEYEMNYFTFAAADQKTGFDTVRIEYWNQTDPKNAKIAGARLLEKHDVNDNPYYIVKLDETIKANKIKMSIGRSYVREEMKVGEIRFYRYDSLEDEIMALYTDEMHMTLRDDVTLQTIQALENRLDTPDAESNEKHPLYQELALEIQTAKEILTTGLDAARRIHPQITAQKDGHLGFGGLNAWQPLGRTAYAKETLLVYVGHPTKRTGDAAQLQLVFTQHHAESSGLARVVNLKVGRNMITVPQLSDKEAERGGQIYAAYTGNSDTDAYAVRISGGSSIPVLDVYGKNANERTEAIRAYIQELEAHTAFLETQHQDVHTGTKHTDAAYDAANCILNATDILMEKMMYSLPASQVLSGIGKDKSLDEKVSQLDQSLQAMEQMMTLFYQHKGLSDGADTEKMHRYPSQHLNIRYMRMFAGAFMYAAGNHIGIEWGSATLAGAAKSWNSFGWGIAHEIGHNINQGSYAIAEVTNNYFAQLMKKIADGTTRFSYDQVYKKVTSKTIGRSSNVATQLAMYWQLYLAYGNEKNDARIYTNAKEQFDNLFFARVDTYARNPKAAPQGGVTLDGGTDQNLMRLACAAAEKNILTFFERWGMVADETTIKYANQFEKETKAIYYVNDAVRDYRIDQKEKEQTDTILEKDAVTASVKAESNEVTITMQTNQNPELVLGYEIIRSMTNNGQTESEVIGFQPMDAAESTIFTDRVSTVNNRVLSYKVRAVDKFLNYSNAADAGFVKIQTDGILDKSGWTITETNMISKDDTDIPTDADHPDSGYDAEEPGRVEAAKVNSIARIIDNDTTKEGTYQEATDRTVDTASVTIDMHRIEAVTALKYQGSKLDSITIEVSQNGQDDWLEVKKDYTGLKNAKETQKTDVWFDAVKETEREHWIGTYDARYIRLTFKKSGPAVIQEIEICGPSGDNLEFLTAESGKPAVGTLKADYSYGTGTKDVIPKGSLVFTGTYKGNPAYNVIILYDADGNVIGAKDKEVHAEQVIFAPDPKDGNLGETSDGAWVYYIEPGDWDETTVRSLQGIRGELYRVDDAKTMEAERIVSDTQLLELPAVLPEITLTGSSF